MPRLETRTTQRIIDLVVLSGAFWVAFLLRFDGDLPYQYLKRALFLWPYVTILQYVVMSVFRVPSFSWRYIGLREATRMLLAMGVSAAILLAVRLTVVTFLPVGGPAQYVLVPIGIILIDFAVAFIGIAGVRAMRRLTVEREENVHRKRADEQVPTLLVGAGRAGLLVAREIERRPDLGIKAVGFVDDDPSKIGTVLHGVKVLGPTAQLPNLIGERGIQQVLISIANAPGNQIRRIVGLCEAIGITPKIIPGIYEIIDGRVNLARIREVSIEDLLRREAVDMDLGPVRTFITGKRVLVTGAGGSIGSEICRQVARFEPELLVLLDQAEPSLWAIHHELASEQPGLKTDPWLCDVTDASAIAALFQQRQPQVVFHAAAHKHVPMVEYNPGEAVHNNVTGTHNLAEAAHRAGCEAFVLISTDKAVNPTSIMGATKRVAEMCVQSLAESSTTKFVAVRFGNVLGSTGSVVPIFKAQIARGGPVTVTHPEMKRYFMTIPEATQLVLQASAMGEGGEVFVLDMGEPVKIVDLALDLIRLSGLEPHEDIPIVFTGIRPGEKLFEELGFNPETMDRTRHPKIFVVKLAPEPWERVNAQVAKMRELRTCREVVPVRQALAVLVKELHETVEASSQAVPVNVPSRGVAPAHTE